MADHSAKETIHRLLSSPKNEDSLDALNYVREAGLKILFSFENTKPRDSAEKEAHLLFSMTILKCNSIMQIAKGDLLQNSLDNRPSLLIYDPFSIMSIVRSQFEAFCAFTSIFVHPKTEEEQKLFHLLWVISRLKYRQRFPARIPENIQKKEDEKKQLVQLESELLQNPFFLNLSSKDQQFIKDRVKAKDWQCYFDGTTVKKAGWEDLALQVAGCSEALINQRYSYLSMSTHPSNMSTFQFNDLRKNNTDKFMTNLGITLSTYISAMLIADFARINSQARISFEQLPPIHQALLNMLNQIFRSPTHVINDIHKALLNN